MICTQVTQISHSTVGSSFSVSFHADSTPNDLEMLRMMREWFMRWNNSGVSFTKADTPQTDKVICPNCGRSDYIRSFEKDFGIKNSEYRYKCINCNTYIKDTPQTDCGWK